MNGEVLVSFVSEGSITLCHAEEPFDSAQDKLRDEASKIWPSITFQLSRVHSTTSLIKENHAEEWADSQAHICPHFRFFASLRMT
jgi:hypothetical protein